MLRFWSDFQKSQNWETPSYLSNLKSSDTVLFKVKGLIMTKPMGGGAKKLKSYLLSNEQWGEASSPNTPCTIGLRV